MNYFAPKALSRSQCIEQPDGTYVIVVPNPLVGNILGLPPNGTLLPSDPAGLTEGLLTIQDDTGEISLRAKDNIGTWQRAVKVGMMMVFNGCYEIPCAF